MDHRPTAIKLIEKSTGVNLRNLRSGTAFLDMTPNAQARK